MVEVDFPFFDRLPSLGRARTPAPRLHQVLPADHVGTSRPGRLMLILLSEHGHFNPLACQRAPPSRGGPGTCAVRQLHGPPHQLVGLSRVDLELEHLTPAGTVQRAVSALFIQQVPQNSFSYIKKAHPKLAAAVVKSVNDLEKTMHDEDQEVAGISKQYADIEMGSAENYEPPAAVVTQQPGSGQNL